MTRFVAAVVAAVVGCGAVAGQQPPTPGPEHEVLKKMVGTWDTTMKAGGMEFKGTATYKLDLGGLWLAGAVESDLGGQRFGGRSLESYDAGKKKYVSVWVDSMGTVPMLMEGTYDAAAKTMTMTGDGPGPDGKVTKWKSVAAMADADAVTMSMFVGDAKEPMFTMHYKRKK
jgi:hypothetical protein